MAIADQIVIMKDGEVEDSGAPQQVYSRPRSRFSAQFMGESNIFDARVVDGVAETVLGRLPVQGEGRAGIAIRPENLTLSPEGGNQPLGQARLDSIVFQGSFARVALQHGDTPIAIRVPPQGLPDPGAMVDLFLRPGGASALER